MARRWIAAAALAALAGCQQPQQSARLVAPLPSPNWNGPTLIAAAPRPAPATAPALAAITPRVEPAPSAPVVRAMAVAPADDVPPGWSPAVASRPWRWIVIHHSASASGSAATFDAWHKAKGWDELGYHFVVDNGSGGPDGTVEIGPRWDKQKWGAHAKTPDNRFNDFGIGICVVGNFDVDQPTDAQMQSVATLVAYLMKTYRIPPQRVVGHGDTKATDCPGKNMSLARVRRMAVEKLGADGASLAASGDVSELLVDVIPDVAPVESPAVAEMSSNAETPARAAMPTVRATPAAVVGAATVRMASLGTAGTTPPGDGLAGISRQAAAGRGADVLGDVARQDR